MMAAEKAFVGATGPATGDELWGCGLFAGMSLTDPDGEADACPGVVGAKVFTVMGVSAC